MLNLFKKIKKSEILPARDKKREAEDGVRKETAVKGPEFTGRRGKYPLGVLVAPRITEKSTALSKNVSQYVFEVSDKANAYQVREAVQGRYGVKVEKVNIINQPGHKVRLGRKKGWRKGFKKAVITVVKGQSIEFT